ncbi:MAG: hypothetical protein O9284_10315 [Steroidobacteraceae bacterium]|nr:hypothetical protein [Steroidobacteraceae bacterium]
MTDGNDQDFVPPRSIVAAVRKPSDGSCANFGTLDSSGQRMLLDQSKFPPKLLKQSAPQACLLRLIELRGRQQLLLRFREEPHCHHFS